MDPPLVAADVINAVEAEGLRRRDAYIRQAETNRKWQDSEFGHRRIPASGEAGRNGKWVCLQCGMVADKYSHEHWFSRRCGRHDSLAGHPEFEGHPDTTDPDFAAKHSLPLPPPKAISREVAILHLKAQNKTTEAIRRYATWVPVAQSTSCASLIAKTADHWARSTGTVPG